MAELIEAMRAAMFIEYNRAADIHGPRHNSPHEAYAVMLEEYEEHIGYMRNMVGPDLEELWEHVKHDKPIKQTAEALRDCTLWAAAELIQFAAMAHKATLEVIRGGSLR